MVGGGPQQFAVCSCVSKKAYIQVHPNNTISYMLHTATATATATVTATAAVPLPLPLPLSPLLLLSFSKSLPNLDRTKNIPMEEELLPPTAGDGCQQLVNYGGRGTPAANGWRWPPTAGQTWCPQRLCRPMQPMVQAASVRAAALPLAGQLHQQLGHFLWTEPCDPPTAGPPEVMLPLPAQASMLPLTGYTYVPTATPVCEPPCRSK